MGRFISYKKEQTSAKESQCEILDKHQSLCIFDIVSCPTINQPKNHKWAYGAYWDCQATKLDPHGALTIIEPLIANQSHRREHHWVWKANKNESHKYRWKGIGSLAYHPYPPSKNCIDTSDSKHVTRSIVIVGVYCDEGHRHVSYHKNYWSESDFEHRNLISFCEVSCCRRQRCLAGADSHCEHIEKE